MRKMKNNSFFWGIIMFALVAFVGVYAAHYASNEKYIQLEKRMVEAIKSDTKLMDEIKNSDRNSVMNDTIKNKVNLEVEGDMCVGEVKVVKNIFGTFFRPKLTCNNYKTFQLFGN